MQRTFGFCVLFGCLLALIGGCGPGGVTFSAKLVKGGADYKPAAGEMYSVSITESAGKAFSSQSDENGKFTFRGNDSPLNAGTYKVSVTIYNTNSKTAPATKAYPEDWVVASGKEQVLDISKLK